MDYIFIVCAFSAVAFYFWIVALALRGIESEGNHGAHLEG